MVFYSENCSDLMPEKLFLGLRKTLKIWGVGRGFAKMLRSLEQFIHTTKVRTIFETYYFLNLLQEVPIRSKG